MLVFYALHSRKTGHKGYHQWENLYTFPLHLETLVEEKEKENLKSSKDLHILPCY